MTEKDREILPESEEREAVPEEGFREPGDEAGELRTKLAYLAAEFDNYRKRSARERESLVAYGNERLLRAILPFLDNLERAMEAASDSPGPLLEGIRMTHAQFLGELRKFGLEPLAAVDSPFDPNLHEAVATVPGAGKPEGTVVAEGRRGYLLHGRLLRPAQVTVALGSASPEEEGAGGPSSSPAED